MSLFKILEAGVPNLLRGKGIKIEELAFRLHSKTTTLMIFALSTLTCATEYIGKNIQCLPVKDDKSLEEAIPAKFIETYCYIQTTFTVPFNTEGKHHDTFDTLSGNMPGGWPYVEGRTPKIYHAYYQWVPFFLFFLALLFTMPHIFWKNVENGQIQSLIQELNAKDLLILKEKQAKQIKLLASYIWKSKGLHKYWSTVYVFCEILNLVTVVTSMYLTDVFLNGEFAEYGIKVLQFLEEDPETRMDPMAFVFPRLTKCQFRRFGHSGNLEKFDTLCILSSNILNEKIFVFLWFWFILITIVTIVMLLYRMATTFSFRVRVTGLGIPTFTRNSQVLSVLERFGVADWILLRLLRINLDDHTFKSLITALYDEVLNERIGHHL